MVINKPTWVNDSAYQRWMGTITRTSTKAGYKSAFKTYIEFTGLTPTQLIDEAVEDQQKKAQEKTDIVLRRIIDFYNWLKTDYPKRSRGIGPHKIIGKGVSDKLAHMRVGAVRSFYGTFDVVVRMKGRQRLPRARVRNQRMTVKAEHIKVLLDRTRSPRDRAIILTMFQSGIDVSTLCSLTFGDFNEALQKNEQPLKLDLYRPKSGVEFYTFLGKDAVIAIQAYIQDMTSRGVTFNYSMPLFLKERGKQGMTTNLVQNMMKIVAVNSGFVSEKNNGKSFNPLGPHALRESFGSLMINSGVPDTIVDFWLGHSIGEMNKAYKSVQLDSLKRMYLERENLLTVSGSELDVKKIEQKVRVEVEQQNRELQTMVHSLLNDNMGLKNRLKTLEDKQEENQLLQEKLLKTEDEINMLAGLSNAQDAEIDSLREKSEKHEELILKMRDMVNKNIKLLDKMIKKEKNQERN